MNLPASPRLAFRCWREADQPLALSLWTDAEVSRYLGGPMSPEEARARLRLEMDTQRRLGVQYWPIFFRTDGDFAGCAGLRPFHQEPGVYELGVHIARSYWGARLGEEAARAVMRHAFETLGARALTAGHHPENRNSQALIERLGFRFTHKEPWGPLAMEHPFYRIERPSAER